MKNRPTPTQVEIKLPEDVFIVSKSDLKGNVTYCNRTLMDISGYREPELIGKQHNQLRHPDMPRTMFKLLWTEIQAGKECFVYVKNLCKNGDYYWVFANVTPDLDDNNNVIGYYSVRRTPSASAVQEISSLYSNILAAENQSSGSDGINAGMNVLTNFLTEGGFDYESFVLSL